MNWFQKWLQKKPADAIDIAGKVDEEIQLGDYLSVRAYMIGVLGKDLDYRKKPKEHIPWPQDSVKYIRFSSKELMTPNDTEQKAQKMDAIKYMNELRNRTKRLRSRDAKNYTMDYVVSVAHHGQRVLDKVRSAKRQLDDLQKDDKTWSGIVKRVADIFGFRGLSGAGAYYVLDGPLAEVEIPIPKIGPVKGRDIKFFGGGALFAIASMFSYAWGSGKRRKVYKRLKVSLDKLYREGISDTMDILERYYPETLIDVDIEDNVHIDEAGKMLMKKHLRKNGK